MLNARVLVNAINRSSAVSNANSIPASSGYQTTNVISSSSFNDQHPVDFASASVAKNSSASANTFTELAYLKENATFFQEKIASILKRNLASKSSCIEYNSS